MTNGKRNEDLMLRKTFENEIQQVKDDVLVLGRMVEQAILGSVEALKKRDIKASEKIFDEDKEINKKRFDIENKLMVLIATQQPMAHDLRHRLLCSDQDHQFVFDIKSLLIDFLIFIEDFFRCLDVAFFQRFHRPENCLLYHAAKHQHIVFDLLNFIFKCFAQHKVLVSLAVRHIILLLLTTLIYPNLPVT